MPRPVDRATPASTNGAAVSSLANCSTLPGALSRSCASNSASASCTGTVSRAQPGQVIVLLTAALADMSSRTGTGAYQACACFDPLPAVRVNAGPNITWSRWS